ncbi:MAG: hypothetical protein FWH46_06895 [Methanimicrococcus sp.]|nr:hypothetical protein [Methanimicrococcus sp.]
MDKKNSAVGTAQVNGNQQSAEKPQNVDKIKEFQQKLDEQIAKSQLLHEKITLRDKFLTLKTQLQEIAAMEAENNDDVFEGNNGNKIAFLKSSFSSSRFEDTSILTIKNPFLIAETVNFMIAKVDEKIKALETEILS